MNAKQFQAALRQLAAKTEGSKPVALHNSVKRILDRCEGFEGRSLDELLQHISSPKKLKSVGSRSSSVRPAAKQKKQPHSEAFVRQVVRKLVSLEKDEVAFNKYLSEKSDQCSAKTIKVVAAKYAASTVPKTKTAALNLLTKARGNKLRANLKLKESSKATPW